MKRICFASYILLLFVNVASCSGGKSFNTCYNRNGDDTFEIISLNEYFDGEGAIVPSEYDLPLLFEDNPKRFTPSKNHVIKAEKLFSSRYDSLSSNGEMSNELESFSEYNRQYIGYINSSGDSLIVTLMMNHRASRADEYLEGWKCNVVVGSGPFFEQHHWMFEANLSKGQLDLF
jgi:hypothetical protein